MSNPAADLVAHYQQRLRDLLPYSRHKTECAYTQWQVMELLQKQRGPTYSAGPHPACSCGFAALGMIIAAEVLPEVAMAPRCLAMTDEYATQVCSLAEAHGGPHVWVTTAGPSCNGTPRTKA